MTAGWCTALFVPADRPRMLRKAQTLGADLLIIDLEDAIAPAGKQAARDALRAELESECSRGSPRCW